MVTNDACSQTLKFMYPNPLQIWQTHTDRELIKQKLTHADVF